MAGKKNASFFASFRRFFVRGLAVLLPSVITIWILVAVYNFTQEKIAAPINRGVRELVLQTTDYPMLLEEYKLRHEKKLEENNPNKLTEWRKTGKYQELLVRDARRALLNQQWQENRHLLDLIGLIIAIVLIYMVGALLGSFIGRRIYHRLEELLFKVPLIREVYPSIKQITDFLFGDNSDKKMKFNQVVAVEYPRKGLWSIGLVTGDTMSAIEDKSDDALMTVFIPSSPTPFTGYVITVREDEAIDLPITIDEALRFTISGGVIIPPSQQRPGQISEQAEDSLPQSAQI